MNALNIFLTTAGFIITMLGIGLAIIRGAEFMSKEKVQLERWQDYPQRMGMDEAVALPFDEWWLQ